MASPDEKVPHIDAEPIAERTPAVSPTRRNANGLVSAPEYVSEKSPDGAFTDEKRPSVSPTRDVEKGGVRRLKRHPSSHSSPFYWLFLSYVAAEAGGLAQEYLLLKFLCLDRSERIRTKKFPLRLPWPLPPAMSTEFVLGMSIIYLVSVSLLYYDRRHDQYQNRTILVSMLLGLWGSRYDTQGMPWRQTWLMYAACQHVMIACALEMSAIGHTCVRVWQNIRACCQEVSRERLVDAN